MLQSGHLLQPQPTCLGSTASGDEPVRRGGAAYGGEVYTSAVSAYAWLTVGGLARVVPVALPPKHVHGDGGGVVWTAWS